MPDSAVIKRQMTVNFGMRKPYEIIVKLMKSITRNGARLTKIVKTVSSGKFIYLHST